MAVHGVGLRVSGPVVGGKESRVMDPVEVAAARKGLGERGDQARDCERKG